MYDIGINNHRNSLIQTSKMQFKFIYGCFVMMTHLEMRGDALLGVSNMFMYNINLSAGLWCIQQDDVWITIKANPQPLTESSKITATTAQKPYNVVEQFLAEDTLVPWQ